MTIPKLQQPGTYIGLNPKGYGPLVLLPCQCEACRVIRERNKWAIQPETSMQEG